MKRFITLAATVAAAMAVMVAVGAAPASAGTVLCTKPVSNCAPSDVRPKGKFLTTGGSGIETFRIHNESGSNYLTCSYNIMSMKSTLKNGNPLPGEFNGALYPPRCDFFLTGPGGCATTTMNNPPVTAEATANGSGFLRIGSASQPFAVTLKCAGTIFGDLTCTFTATGTVDMATSSEGGVIKNEPIVNTGPTAGLCGGSSSPKFLTVENHLNGTELTYLSKASGTVLCASYETNPCPNGSVLPAGTSFGVQGTEFKLKNPEGTGTLFSCGQSMLGFASTQEEGNPLPANSEGNIWDCAPMGGQNCISVDLGDPASTIQSTGVGTGTVTIGSAGQPLTLSFKCESIFGTIHCNYAAAGGVPIEVKAGEATVKAAVMTLVSNPSGSICYSSARLHVKGGIISSPSGPQVKINTI